MPVRVLAAALVGWLFAAYGAAAQSSAPAPTPAWTGFYAGLNVGYGFGGGRTVTTAAGTAAETNACFNGNAPCTPFNATIAAAANSRVAPPSDGIVGGLQVGYNWTLSRSFVAGLEADIQGAGLKGTDTTWTAGPVAQIGCGGAPGNTCWIYNATTATRALDYIGTLRLRAGWLATPGLLLYATGGLAFGGARLDVLSNGNDAQCWNCTFPIAGRTGASRILLGWTAGAGVEWMLGPKLSVKAEYLRYDLGSVAANGLQPAFNSFAPFNLYTANATSSRARFDGNLVRVGLNYHFEMAGGSAIGEY